MSNFERFRYIDTIPMSVKLRRFAWLFVWSVAFQTTPRWTCHGWRRTLLRSFGATIGKGCKISPTCFVWAPWNLTMGEYSVLGDSVDCYTMATITIGSKVAVSQRSFLCTGSHDISSLRRPLTTKPIIIADHAWICAEAFVGPGVSIGTGAVVAARACITRDVGEWQIVAGNPAVVKGVRSIKK